jgi:RNA recognition motif-containing protein
MSNSINRRDKDTGLCRKNDREDLSENIKQPIDDKNSVKGECKIFVGNVPYHCSQEEIDACFKDVVGFIKAEIITVYKTNMSRGFGFVTMRSLADADVLKHRDDITLKGRTLRFASYQSESSKQAMEQIYNYVFVDSIPNGKDRAWLKRAFHYYEPIGRCFVAIDPETGESRNNGMIELLDDTKYKSVLNKRYHNIEGVTLETTRYKLRPQTPLRIGQSLGTASELNDTNRVFEISTTNNRMNDHSSYINRNNNETRIFDISRYDKNKIKKITKSKKIDEKDLQSAFMAGKNAGILQSIKMMKLDSMRH